MECSPPWRCLGGREGARWGSSGLTSGQGGVQATAHSSLPGRPHPLPASCISFPRGFYAKVREGQASLWVGELTDSPEACIFSEPQARREA